MNNIMQDATNDSSDKLFQYHYYLAHVLPLYHTWHMYFHRFTHYTILGITTASSMHSVDAVLTNSLHNLATELLLHLRISRSNLTATTVGGIIRSDIKVGSVEKIIRFRQGPSEGDITIFTISIVLDVFTGYIVKNRNGWWCTWVGGGGGGRTVYHITAIRLQL